MISYWNKSGFKKSSTSKFGLSDFNLSVTVLIVLLNFLTNEVNCQGENTNLELKLVKKPNNFQFAGFNRLDANFKHAEGRMCLDRKTAFRKYFSKRFYFHFNVNGTSTFLHFLPLSKQIFKN